MNATLERLAKVALTGAAAVALTAGLALPAMAAPPGATNGQDFSPDNPSSGNGIGNQNCQGQGLGNGIGQDGAGTGVGAEHSAAQGKSDDCSVAGGEQEPDVNGPSSQTGDGVGESVGSQDTQGPGHSSPGGGGTGVSHLGRGDDDTEVMGHVVGWLPSGGGRGSDLVGGGSEQVAGALSAGTVAAKVSTETLPATGSDIGKLALTGLALLGTGLVTTAASGRRTAGA